MSLFDEILDQQQIDKYMAITELVCDELGRAHEKFPEQSLPWDPMRNAIGEDTVALREFARDVARRIVDEAAAAGTLTWDMCFRTIADMDGKEAGNGSAT